MSAETGRLRLEELLFDRATQGLLPVEAGELAGLAAEFPEVDPESFELAAAAVHLTSPAIPVPMPVAIEARIRLQAAKVYKVAGGRAEGLAKKAAEGPSEPEQALRRPLPFNPRPSTPVRRSIPWGWLAAAAGFALAALAWWPQLQPWLGFDGISGGSAGEVAQAPPPGPVTPVPVTPGTGTPGTGTPGTGTPTPAAAPALEDRVAAAPDVQKLPWTATEDPAAAGASGEVLWSTELQAGILRIQGLAANDPAQAQYQLWIFDENQDERFPIDGGVFDVVSERVEIPIDAKIQVRRPLLFAVTVEKPGGVVVSSRERIVLLAQTT
jgi:hypothetical protein